MRRVFWWTIGLAAGTVGVACVLALAILLGANTDPGRRLVESLTARLTQGMVRIEGLAGRFPDEPRIARLQISDAAGPYLTVNDAVLNWSPMRLLRGAIEIERLEAERVALARLPASNTTATEGSAFAPPPAVVERVRIARLEIGAPVAGRAMNLFVEGSATIETADTGRANLNVTDLDRPAAGNAGQYTLAASFSPSRLRATVEGVEGANGLVAGLIQLPNLGGMTIVGSVDGPPEALQTKIAIDAGSARVRIDGTVNIVDGAANLAVSAAAPAMTPASGVSWSSIRLDAKVGGTFAAPVVTGTLRAADLTVAESGADALNVDMSSRADGQLTLQARVERMRIPGPSPLLLAASPLLLDAEIQLATPNRPVRFTLRHPLASAEGIVDTGPSPGARFKLELPDLAPLGRVGGAEMQGHGTLHIDASLMDNGFTLAAKGAVAVDGGMSPLPALIGDTGSFDMLASVQGADVRIQRLSVKGKTVEATATGQLVENKIDADWTLRLSELAALFPTLFPAGSGAIEGRGQISGSPSSFSVVSDLTVDAAMADVRPGRFTVHLQADNLPNAPNARLTADGTLLGAPAALAVEAALRDGATHVTFERGAWKSLTAAGTLRVLPGSTAPIGEIQLDIADLGDFSPFVGKKIGGALSGSLKGSLESTAIRVEIKRASVLGAGEVVGATLSATIDDPTGARRVDGSLAIDGIAVAGMRGSGRLTAKGPLKAVALTLTADLAEVNGAPARLAAAGTLDAIGSALSLTSFRGGWRGEAIRLLAPVRIGFAGDLTVDRLRLGLRQAELEIAGRVGETIDLRAEARNVPANLASLVYPAFSANGSFDGAARLTGATARPEGTIRLKAAGVRMRDGLGRALPPIEATIEAGLKNGIARLDGRMTAGTSRVTVTGSAALGGAGPLDLRIGGLLDLALLEPLLAAEGRSVRGRLNLDLSVGGTLSRPRTMGTIRLAGGEMQDVNLGSRISGIAATIQADGDIVRLTQLTGSAGAGTVSASGSVGLVAPRRLELNVRARNARLLASDAMTAVVDADIAVNGELGGDLAVSGGVTVQRADIRVPENFPPTIAVIPVRVAGAPPKAASRAEVASSPGDIALNVTVNAPSRIFIRGRGLNVELGERLVLGGTLTRLEIQGGFQLRQGTLDVGGQSLAFNSGSIEFTGGGLTDPSLNLLAVRRNAALTITLTVTGSVKNPKIALSSVPELPQDEILSQLLFNTIKSSLSPFQVAQIAAAAASLAGVRSPIGDPLDGIRAALGLDRLTVGSTSDGAPALEASRYLAPGVQIGAKQSATGGQTQATVRIDIAKGLKLETTVGTGSASATGGAAGGDAASVGLTWQFEY